MKISRLPIAILCLCARYFWMYIPLLQMFCPVQSVFSCVMQLEAHQDHWFGAGLAIYGILFLLDVHLLKSKTSVLVKWAVVIFLMHSMSNVHWVVFVEFVDGFTIIFDTTLAFHIQKMISGQLAAMESAAKQAAVASKNEQLSAVPRQEDLQARMFEMLLNKLDSVSRRNARVEAPLSRHEDSRIYAEEKYLNNYNA